MKKIFLGTIILLGFNVVIILTQMSCKKEASAQAANDNKPANLILFYKNSARELWIASIDGSNQRKIPITIPAGLSIGYGRLSADGKTVIFEGFQSSSGINVGLYSCSFDGSGFKKVVDAGNDEILLQDVK